jgi:hypothetical protein
MPTALENFGSANVPPGCAPCCGGRLFEEEQINASYTDGQQSHDRTK